MNLSNWERVFRHEICRCPKCGTLLTGRDIGFGIIVSSGVSPLPYRCRCGEPLEVGKIRTYGLSDTELRRRTHQESLAAQEEAAERVSELKKKADRHYRRY